MARTVASGPTPGRPMFDAEIFARAFERSEGRAAEQRRAMEAGDALTAFAEANGGRGPLEAGMEDSEQRHSFLSQLAQLPPHERASLLMAQPALVASLTNAEFMELMSEQQRSRRGAEIEAALPALMPDAAPEKLSQASAAARIAPDLAMQRLVGEAIPEGLTAHQRESIALARDQLGQAAEQFAASHGLDVQRFKLDTMKAELERHGKAIESADAFSRRWTQHADLYRSELDVVDDMARAASLRSDAGDAELSLAYLRLITGTAVARGGAAGVITELSNVGAIDERIASHLWQTIIGGQRLTDRARAELLEAGLLRGEHAMQRYERERQLYVELARDRGFDPRIAVPDLLSGDTRERLGAAFNEAHRDRALPPVAANLEARGDPAQPSSVESAVRAIAPQVVQDLLGLPPLAAPVPEQQAAPDFDAMPFDELMALDPATLPPEQVAAYIARLERERTK